jgi:hypothetical protein
VVSVDRNRPQELVTRERHRCSYVLKDYGLLTLKRMISQLPRRSDLTGICQKPHHPCTIKYQKAPDVAPQAQ